MHEMKNVRSLSLFVGTGKCNAHCDHCAGIPLRKHAPKEDGIIDKKLILEVVRTCYDHGARYLSLSSSGEPTLSPISVTKTLQIIHDCPDVEFNPINLYSNGIRIGQDKPFCEKYLPLWKNYGLTTLYVTVHNIDERKNASAYGVHRYPPLERIVSRIHDSGLLMRANIVLSKDTISTSEEFTTTIEHLLAMDVDTISAWQIRSLDDTIDHAKAPIKEELDKMASWVERNGNQRIRLLLENSRIAYQIGEKLTLFPDGTLSNSWCNSQV